MPIARRQPDILWDGKGLTTMVWALARMGMEVRR